MVRIKRKRETKPAHDTRLADPYLLQMPPCHFSDHHRKYSKNAGVLRNCENNPNCLYGLGERHEGVWQGSRLVRRVFGSDPRDRKRLSNKFGEPIPCGLRNLGATCYLNSMLQCLFVNLPFRQAVYEWEPKEQPVDENQTLQMRALQKLFARMQLGNESYYDPTEFASTLSLNNGMQQDVQEFSKLLLAHLRTIFRQSRFPGHWDLVDRIFQGQMSYVTKCLYCQNKSMRPSSYYEISLNIKGHKSVEDCIKSYLSAEVLEGENKYFCEQCDAKQCAERYFELMSQALPPTLMVQLMRFVYDAKAGRKKKLTDVIEFSETLNMTELLRHSGHAEAFNASSDVMYRLQGYLNHRGKSAHVGHYTATVAYPKSRKSGKIDRVCSNWFEFDDALVTKISLSDAVKEQTKGRKIRSRDVYMLLYVRDDEAVSSRSGYATLACDRVKPEPSKVCRKDVDALKSAFEAEVIEYASRVSAMETRIQKRLDAYKRFFVYNRPYPDASADHYYWVGTNWLRHWITGEDKDRVVSNSSPSYMENDGANSGFHETVQVDSRPSVMAQSFDKNDTDDDCYIVEPPEVNIVTNERHYDDEEVLNGSEWSSDDKLKRLKTDDGDVLSIREPPGLTSSMQLIQSEPNGLELNGEDIPFIKAVDVAPYCCTHSIGLENNVSEYPQSILRFAPENASRLKRISAEFFTFLAETCGIGNKLTQVMRAFEAPMYRCTICETNFRNKLLDDSDRLKEVNKELELLRGSPISASVAMTTGGSYLMSRAWIRSYKVYLQRLHKKLSHASSTSKKGRRAFFSKNVNEFFTPTVGGSDSVSDTLNVAIRDDGPDIWRNPINEDIVCVHGNLTLEKRMYRSVLSETWSHFSAKFPSRIEFFESTTEPCPQCQVDDISSKKCIQVERNSRDELLSVAALETLYRRKPKGRSIRLVDIFECPAAQRGTGLEKASAWTTQDATNYPRRMFLISRHWLTHWRKYIRNVEESVPTPLTLSSMVCIHQKLVLSPELLAIQQGQSVDASVLGVEFVTMDEMQALAERYGDPETPIYYCLLRSTIAESGEGKCHVQWRQCSLASLQSEYESFVRIQDRSDGIVPLLCQDQSDKSIICSECQASSDQRHRDELENFSNRVVNVQQLNDDESVPTNENLTANVNTSGRRRSRRIRPGSACVWPVTANASDTVYMLKAKIYAEIDALPMRQRLYYKGEMLKDSCSLKHYGIKAGDAVFMRLFDDNADDLVMEEDQEREVGFANSVFLSHPTVNCPKVTSNGAPDTSGDRAMALTIANCRDACVWVCPACTFINDDMDNVCEMCSTTKSVL